ncbi:protein phosphatase CheZ [Roseixanthobacter glucoisosaccharinicivorans]|uniref:protein phosphatase CheZ n=1 Tax=Roseixanthobacter glucoisosaccharinicivorans TaxID=3119923 RepID=UPI00372BDBA2
MSADADFGQHSPVDGQLDRILTELAQMRSEIETFKYRNPLMDKERDRNALWAGLETIQEAIQNTKSEIAALHSEGGGGEQLFRATDELDAVVAATETATETILSAAEDIEVLAAKLSRSLVGDDLALAEAIQAQTIKVFEACNFQDISGQRIGKVVKLLRFVEERISSMANIWGGAAEVATANSIIPKAREGDAALLNGPSLADDANVVSQDDIDSLFN